MSRSDLNAQYLEALDELAIGETCTKDLDYAIHVSLKHKYIFVETPKVACSTIKKTLQRLELENPNFDREDFEDLHLREYSPLLKLQQLPNFKTFFEREDFTIFCFVRNPYNRILSCYLDKIKLPLEVTTFKKKVLNSMGLNEDNIERPISFEEFITVIEKQDPLQMDYHWRPQTYLTCHKMISYDFIGRLENFSDDFKNLGQVISPYFEKYYTHEVRHSTNAVNLLDKYYTDELYNRVFNIYKVDFACYSYNK